MKKRALQLASVASMIDQFNISNIEILQSLGYEVDVAADFTNPGTITAEHCGDLKKRLDDMGVRVFDIAIPRSLNLRTISSAYKKVKELLDYGNYNLLHCHSPVGGVIARQAAKNKRKDGLKVIYTAHGFHFYNGAPVKNWLIFYPIEMHYSRCTDVLITINKEDYKRASEKFHAEKTVYIPGVGVDTEKFKPRKSGRERIRAELGLPKNRIMLLSVGELNENKNHESVIQAVSGLGNLTYVVVGKGGLDDYLLKTASESGVDLKLSGFREDVADFYDAADIYILPSVREGLNLSLMEAMASSLMCLAGRVRGNVDLVDDSKGGYLFSPESVGKIREAVEKAVNMSPDMRADMGRHNLQKIRGFDLQTIENIISEIYRGGEYEHLRILLERQKKRAEIGVPIACKLLISIGELSVRKNHRVVVEALQELPEDYWYVIVGKGGLKSELKNMDHTGQLKLVGFRTDIIGLLHAADLFVFPSLQEGLPVALMEAMAAGMPVVASRIRGNVDLIDDGLVSPLEAGDWKHSIEKAEKSNDLENVKRMLSFDSAKVNRQMNKIYQNVL